MPKRKKAIDENPAQPVVGELDLGLVTNKTPQLEKKIRQQIWAMAAYMPHVKLYRNACGVAHIGRCTIPYGLCAGSADLVGWISVTITPDMVGKKFARWVGIELKTNTGRLGPKQVEWLAMLTEAGGIAGVARSAEEAKELLGR